ncbi:MAG: response regulator, partial [Bacillota bacterium]|nr:response regulator [Bacillota bacterium]
NVREDIDLIFLDIRMPKMNGTEVLKFIRDAGINCPVVIMTAYATVKNAIDCTKLGAVAYLQKPFSPDRVNSVLDEIFGAEVSEDNVSREIEDEGLYIEEARTFIKQKYFKEAHDRLKMALAKNPYNKEIYFLIGEVNENINNLKEAKRFYTISKLFDS